MKIWSGWDKKKKKLDDYGDDVEIHIRMIKKYWKYLIEIVKRMA